jgi:hypothetical protein
MNTVPELAMFLNECGSLPGHYCRFKIMVLFLFLVAIIYIRKIKSERMRRAEYVACMKEMISTYINLARNPEGRRPLSI